MKNLLNRLTRFMIIMLLLVDRTPFFNVYAEAVTTTSFRFLIDVNDSYNAGVGLGKYDIELSEATIWDYSFYEGQTGPEVADFLLANYGIRPEDLTAEGKEFNSFLIVKIEYHNGGPSAGLIKFAGIVATFTQLPLPTANPDVITVNEDTPYLITEAFLMSNDNNAGSLVLDVTSTTAPSNGTLVDNGDQTYTYTPNLNYFGPDSFTYTLNGMTAVPSATTTVTINVLSVNDLPTATSESHTINRGGTVNDAVTGTDVETPTANLTYVIETGPTDYSSFTFNPDGTFVYVHDITKSATPVTFTFRAKDADNALSSNLGTVTINISNLAPVTDDRSFSTDEDVVLNVNATDGLLKNSTDPENDVLVVDTTVGTAPTKGSVVLSADGSFVYTPSANLNGTDSFTYRVSDGKAYSSYKTVTITINPVDDTPVAVDDKATTAEDTPIDIDVIGNDTDIDGGTKNVVSVTQGTNGSVAINPDGTVKYTPKPDFNGSDSFTYTLNGGSTATVTVTVTPVDDAPVAVNDTATTAEDTPVDINVIANDTDIDGGPKNVVSVTQGTNGSVAINPDGTVKYTPKPDFNGSDSFTYTLNGGSTATVNVTVTAVDDAPVAVADSATTPEDTPIDIDVLANDTDSDGGTKEVVDVTQGANGSVVINSDGTVKYTPNANFNGSDSFSYSINGGSSATVTVTVTAVDDAPIAIADSATTPEDTPIDIDVIANDTDIDGGPKNVVSVTQAANGTVTINLDGTVKYAPKLDFSGIDSFTYTLNGGSTATVTVTVTAVDDAPVANDDTATTPEDTPIDIDVLVNDTDVDGGLMEVVSVTQGANGTVTINLDGTVNYAPNANFNGVDGFSYTLNGGSIATVTVTVTAVDDAPVAVADSATTPEDTPIDIDVLANDTDIDAGPMSVASVTQATNGTVTINLDGTVNYSPELNFSGSDSFTYTLNGGSTATVTVTVTPVNDAPVASPLAFTIANAGSSTGQLVASDVDDTELVFSLLAAPTNGTATVSPAGVYTYTHNGTATLSDSFTFSVTDGELSATSTVTVTVLAAPTPPPANLPPIANALAFTIANGAVSTGTLTGSDPEGAPISFAIATLPANGSLTISPAGIYVYDHNGTATTSDSFTFTVSDGSLTATATVSITILPIPTPPPAGNTPPVVIDGVVSTPFGEVIEGSVAPLGSDADGDDLSFALVDDVTNGTLVFNPDGTYTYTPNEGFDGSDRFTFIGNDGTDDSEIATLTINVIEEEVIVEEPETPLAAPNNDWLWWLLALLAGLLLWLLAFLRPNMKYTLSDKANNQKVVRRRLAKPDDKTMVVELNDKDMVGLTTIEVEFFKRLAKHCGDVTVKFMLKGTQVHSVTIPAGIDDAFTTIIHL